MGDYGIAALMGLLGGGGEGLYKGVDAGIQDALNQQKLAEQARQFNESKVMNLPPELAKMFGLPSVTIPTAAFPSAVAAGEKNLSRQVEQEASAKAQAVMQGPGTNEEKSNQIVGIVGLGKPQMEAFQNNLARPKPIPMSENAQGIYRPGLGNQPGTFEPAPWAATEPPQPSAPDYLYGAPKEQVSPSGRVRMTREPLPANMQQHAQSLVKNNVQPGSPEWFQSMADYGKTIPVEGVGPFGASSAAMPSRNQQVGAGGAPQPLGGLRADRPVSPQSAHDLAAGQGLMGAVGNIEQALQNPNVRDYLGPVAQYRSTLQRYTPQAALGAVPPEVTQLEQNLARLTNYTIKLITGAQMSEREADRIRKEIPNQMLQPEEFANRLATTKENIRKMTDTIRRLALTGNQQAKMSADELGLGVGPAPAAAPAPALTAAPPAAAPAQSQYKEGQRLYSPSQKRYFRIQNGVPVPE